VSKRWNAIGYSEEDCAGDTRFDRVTATQLHAETSSGKFLGGLGRSNIGSRVRFGKRYAVLIPGKSNANPPRFHDGFNCPSFLLWSLDRCMMILLSLKKGPIFICSAVGINEGKSDARLNPDSITIGCWVLVPIRHNRLMLVEPFGIRTSIYLGANWLLNPSIIWQSSEQDKFWGRTKVRQERCGFEEKNSVELKKKS